jgi:hypothetical protein
MSESQNPSYLRQKLFPLPILVAPTRSRPRKWIRNKWSVKLPQVHIITLRKHRQLKMLVSKTNLTIRLPKRQEVMHSQVSEIAELIFNMRRIPLHFYRKGFRMNFCQRQNYSLRKWI